MNGIFTFPPISQFPLGYSALGPTGIPGMVYANFGWRFLAWLLDTIITSVGGGIVGFILGAFIGLSMGNTPQMRSTAETAGQISGVIIGWLYFAIMESSKTQATLGKMACGMVVTDLNGNPISFGRATGRFFGKYISAIIVGIGFLMNIWTEKSQTLHDIMAGTLVMKKP